MQTRQDLHRRHAREREALEARARTLQQQVDALKAAAADSAADSARPDVQRLQAENKALRERADEAQREAAQLKAPLATAQAANKQLHDTVAQLQHSMQLQQAKQGSTQQLSFEAAELKVRGQSFPSPPGFLYLKYENDSQQIRNSSI